LVHTNNRGISNFINSKSIFELEFAQEMQENFNPKRCND